MKPLTLTLLLIPSLVFSQYESGTTRQHEFGMTLGANAGNYFFGELGAFYSKSETALLPLKAFTINTGVEFTYVESLILAPKVQCRYTYQLFNFGLSTLYHFQEDAGSAWTLRPEIGVGVNNAELTYGYSFLLHQNGFNRFNTHTISLRVFLPLIKKPTR